MKPLKARHQPSAASPGKALALLDTSPLWPWTLQVVLSRLKESSVPMGTNYMNVLSTMPCTQQVLCLGVELN